MKHKTGDVALSRLAVGSAAACIGFGLCSAADSLPDYHEEALLLSGVFAATGVVAMGVRSLASRIRRRKRKSRSPCRRKARLFGDSWSEAEFVEFLAKAGLTEKERRYVLVCLSGETLKVVAAENGVTDSTARNACAAIYRKLDVHGKAELMALGAAYRGVGLGPAPKETRRGTGKEKDQDPAITTPS